MPAVFIIRLILDVAVLAVADRMGMAGRITLARSFTAYARNPYCSELRVGRLSQQASLRYGIGFDCA
jgi:hypothetical protein